MIHRNETPHIAADTIELSSLGVVAIGRNEGERFERCVASLSQPEFSEITKVYVDSGSTDNSVNVAKDAGWMVVSLDTSIPFTAARARNAGVDALLSAKPESAAVMFVDGDCQLDRGWLPVACEFLNNNPQVAVVAGQRQETKKEASVYNHMCDMEWQSPEGQTSAVGGDSVMRVSVFKTVGGFDPSFIAGEEPELCLRIRALGHHIWVLDVPMTYHDANIHRPSQWFKRVQRAGYAFARLRVKHRFNDPDYWKKELRSAWIWGGVFPLLFLLGLVYWEPLAFVVLLLFVVQWFRIGKRETRLDRPYQYALMVLLGKSVELSGVFKCYYTLSKKQSETLIEYK